MATVDQIKQRSNDACLYTQSPSESSASVSSEWKDKCALISIVLYVIYHTYGTHLQMVCWQKNISEWFNSIVSVVVTASGCWSLKCYPGISSFPARTIRFYERNCPVCLVLAGPRQRTQVWIKQTEINLYRSTTNPNRYPHWTYLQTIILLFSGLDFRDIKTGVFGVWYTGQLRGRPNVHSAPTLLV